MTYNRKFVLPFCFALGLILAAAFVLGGCTSRDQLRGPTEAQRAYDSIRPMLDTMQRGAGL